jgi:hypothetical protein
MTLEELNQPLTARGMASKVHIDGVSRAGSLDNVWVVGLEGARWVLKWHERGESEVVASYSTESDVATAVLQRLSQTSPRGCRRPARPAIPASTSGIGERAE